MFKLKTALVTGLAAGAGLLATSMAVLGMLSHKPPQTLGLMDGKLRPCPPGSQNCVSSESSESERHIAPFELVHEDPKALEQIAAVVRTMPRARVVALRPEYLHAEFTSLIFRFVDDVELRLDVPPERVHLRSASRVGKGDLGVNRRRVEELRQRLRQDGLVR